MLIHKEGKKTLLYTFIALGAVNVVLFYFFYKCIPTYSIFGVSVIIFLIMLNFFKQPKRIYTGQLLGSVNAPTDGKVVVVEKVFEKDFLQAECIQVSIFMSLFNAHSNWMPVTGKVVHVSHQDGRFLGAYLPKSSHENERSNIVIETPDGHKILTRQIAGAMARRIVTYVKEGENYCIGDPLGFIKLGSRMDVFLPLDSEILVQLGEEVRANKTFLAHFNPGKQTEKE
ncbi:MAG: phosphatidylserine decarboxylase family protein [Dysgonamonadaceae bacterium]|jgi:phosphatidylserine decarboxylase|nr:phosphatidylserine decarboxylase family protein [Dysgonamonadaceae bacterium]